MTDTPARRLGSSYVLQERVGAGAQGEVWRGHHVDSTEPLAFKVLRADLVDDPAVVERFIKERSTLLRVRSPYVVAIRDVVIEGSTFAPRARCRRHAWPPRGHVSPGAWPPSTTPGWSTGTSSPPISS